MSEATEACGWCGEELPIVYTDAIGLPWCRGCYNDTFQKEDA